MGNVATPRPFLRIWRWLAIIAAVLAGTYWLLGSETFLRFAAGQAEQLSGDTLHIDGVHGSLFGPLRIDTLTFDTRAKRVEIRDVQLDWSPRALWRGSLRIGQLAMAQVRITELKPSLEPPTLPTSLALPLSVEVPQATLQRLEITTPGGTTVFTDIALALTKATDTYQLTVSNVTTPRGSLQGRASLAENRPYRLTASGTFSRDKASARFDATGTLARIDLHATAAVANGQADARLVATPFEPGVLAEAHVKVRNLDPSTLDGQWPHASLDLDANLAGDAQSRLAGEIALNNASPGPLDLHRLPLKKLTVGIATDRQEVHLNDLRLDLAEAGQFTGLGKAAADGLSLTLHTRNLNPKGLYSRMRTLRLAGDVGLQLGADRQTFTAELGDQRYQLTLDADRQKNLVRLNKALLSSGGGSLSLEGSVQLDTTRRFKLAGKLRHFDPAAFGDYPSAGINVTFTGEGHMAPSPEGSLQFALDGSSLRHRPLSGHGRLSLDKDRLSDSDVALDLAGNRLELHGAYGSPGDRLSFTVNAGRLNAIDPALSGRIEGEGMLTGTLDEPAGRLKLRGESLAWGKDFRLQTLAADCLLEPTANGAVRVNLSLSGLKTPDLGLERASVQIQGRRNNHRIDLSARNDALDLTAELAGAWQARAGTAGVWSGRIAQLRNSGRYPAALRAPADLVAGRNRLHLANARLDLLGGSFDLAELDYQPGELTSHGRYENLPLDGLAKIGELPEEIGGNLTLAGDWNIRAADHVNGHVTTRRRGGDLMFATEPAIRMGLTDLGLTVDAKDDQVTATLAAAGTTLGTLRATADTQLSKRSGRWGVAGSAPLHASADFALKSLAWASPLVDRNGGIRLAGSLQGQLQAEGTVAAPRLGGSITGKQIGLLWTDQGLNFVDGEFAAELRQDSLELTRLVWHGGDGQLTGHGRLKLDPAHPEMQLSLNADKLQAISRPDRLLVLSGTGRLGLAGRTLRAEANLRVDRGQFELPRSNTPQVSSDVVVLGRPAASPSETRLPALDLDLSLDLGDRFSVTGRGLDAQLGGTVRVTKQDKGILKGNGTIRVVKGSYYAYGQQLSIERGLVNFQGPLDNPGLNIVAMRKNQDVEAGVAITGSAQAPQIKLVSEPTVSDSEKLSWLVLGHGLADTSSGEMSSLQLAAGALLGAGQSVPLQQRIANAVGLSELNLKGSGTLESTVVSLGKRLSSRAYLTFEQGLAGSEPLMKLNYRLTKRLSVSTQAGAAPAVDLFYTFSFD